MLAVLSALLASLCVFWVTLPATNRRDLGSAWLGVVSSVFVALFPVLLLRAYHALYNSSAFQTHRPDDLEIESEKIPHFGRTQESMHVFWSTLRLATTVSTALMVLVFIFSGEVQDMSRNSYVLDAKIVWLLVICTGILAAVTLILTLLLVVVASPVIAAFLLVPEGSLEILVLAHHSLTLHSWMGLVACWLSSLYFLFKRGKEGLSNATSWGQNLSAVLLKFILPLALYVGISYTTYTPKGRLPTQHVSSFGGGKHNAYKSEHVAWFNQTGSLYVPKDDYLGPRPHADTVANLSMLVEHCREPAGGREVDDTVNCLSYLANNEQNYLWLPEAGHGSQASEQDQEYANPDTRNKTQIQYLSSPAATAASALSVGICAGPIIPFHVYWTGSATWRFELFAKAYLYTQNLPCSRLWIWLDCDVHPDSVNEMLYEDPIFERFRPLVERGDIILKAWKFPDRVPIPKEDEDTIERDSYTPIVPNEDDEIRISKDTVQDNNGQRWLLLDPTHVAFSPVVVSDAVRFIVLHMYGGVYCDMDVLLLRDMRPLVLPDSASRQRAFAEQWAMRSYPGNYNTAVLTLPANSSLSLYLLRGGLRMGFNFHPRAIGHMMWRDGRVKELTMLHNANFDPVVTNLRRVGTSACTVPCFKNWKSVFMSEIEEAPKEWSDFEPKSLQGADVQGPDRSVEIEGARASPMNRSLENFFQGAWSYHIHNQVCP